MLKDIKNSPLVFLYLPLGVIMIYFLFIYVNGELGYCPHLYGWLAFVISLLASLFVVSHLCTLRYRVVIVVVLGIIASILPIWDGHAQSYAALGAGIVLVASAITFFRGVAEELPSDISGQEVRSWVFHVITAVTIGVGAFIVAFWLSSSELWRYSLDIPSNTLTGNIPATMWPLRNQDALLAIALYYFLGLGLMVLETTLRTSKKK